MGVRTLLSTTSCDLQPTICDLRTLDLQSTFCIMMRWPRTGIPNVSFSRVLTLRPCVFSRDRRSVPQRLPLAPYLRRNLRHTVALLQSRGGSVEEVLLHKETSDVFARKLGVSGGGGRGSGRGKVGACAGRGAGGLGLRGVRGC